MCNREQPTATAAGVARWEVLLGRGTLGADASTRSLATTTPTGTSATVTAPTRL